MVITQKRLSRKGQELSITTLILIVLGVVILVLLILGFTRGWDWIIGKFDLLPGQSLETLAQSCNVAAQGGLAVDFCSFKKIKVDSVTQYLNCQDPRLQASITSEDKPSCSPDAAKQYCISQKLKDDALINSQACSSFYDSKPGNSLPSVDTSLPLCEAGAKKSDGSFERPGKLVSKTSRCPPVGYSAYTRTLTDGFREKDASLCCVPQ